jgi:hypothetical protein
MLLTLIAVAGLVPAGWARAEEADGDVEALRAEVQRLSDQVKALQTAQDAQAKAAQDKASQEAQAKAAEEAQAQAAEQVKASVEERLDLVEVKQDDAVVKGDIPGSFRIPGTDVSMRVYGFAELDWVHLFRGDNADMDYSTFAPYLPLEGSVEAGRKHRDYMTIRESRIGIEAGMPTRFGVLGAKIEGDFNNEPRTGNSAVYGAPANVYTQQATNSYGFRVRHAFGQFGGLLVGQTWSTFMDVDNFPETVDYNGPVGATFIRQPQIRLSYPTAKLGTFTAALENSSTYVLDETATAFASSASRMPDMIVRWDRGFGFGALSLRGMTQELRLKDDGLDVKKRGYGVAASGLFKARGGADFLTWGVTFGEGIGRYLNYVEGALYDAAQDEILLEKAIGAYAGYQFKPSDFIRFNFAYGVVHELDNDFTKLARSFEPDFGRFAVNRNVQQAHAGFFVSPVKAVDMGLEGIWANRRTLAGAKGEDLRVNFLTRYYIN